DESIPAGADDLRAFLYGPLGATVACAYILLAYIAWHPYRNKERWAYNCIVGAFGLWIILDSAIAWHYGMYIQVYGVNLFSFLVKALPLVFTFREFYPKPGGLT
ncbi:MAG: hypothetical protein M3Q97_04005, partial [Bacteroidota bacterium]|nr:hypothetical protein [Bacteroidota bacterium]